MEKHFKLTENVIVNEFGIKLFQIKCTRNIKYAKIGDLGGWIESEKNLAGDAWVFGDARVFGNARVSGDAEVSGNAKVFGDARVFGNARVSGDAEVSGNAKVSGDAWVFGDARVFGNARVSGDARVSGNAKVSGDAEVSGNDNHCGFDCFGSCNRHTHAYITKSKEVEITCGCFRGSIKEFEEQIHKKHFGTIYEKQYMAIVNVIKIKFGLI